MSLDNAHVTLDLIYGGRARVRQPARGYRVNLDTILLAAAVDEGGLLVEAGCGVAAALICVARRWPGARLIGIERDAGIAALARENLVLNALDDRAQIREADALAAFDEAPPADGVFFNPPFDPPGEGTAPAESRRAAHVAERPIGDWVKVWSNRLAGGGLLTLIHRAERLADILAAMQGKLGAVEVFPLRPKAEAPASRVLVRARKGSRAPLRLLRGLDLHDESGAKHTPEAEAVLRGECPIDWRD
jgi:tRNA1(Val) A37 N6-methylase TrmN6